MTEQEALNELKLQSIVLENRIVANREIEEFVSSALLEQRKNAIDIGIKALEKQIPKKVKEIYKSECIEDIEAYGGDALFGYCPCCNELNSNVWNEFYCGNCGQKLEW